MKFTTGTSSTIIVNDLAVEKNSVMQGVYVPSYFNLLARSLNASLTLIKVETTKFVGGTLQTTVLHTKTFILRDSDCSSEG